MVGLVDEPNTATFFVVVVVVGLLLGSALSTNGSHNTPPGEWPQWLALGKIFWEDGNPRHGDNFTFCILI
jgi:hypothetical protein